MTSGKKSPAVALAPASGNVEPPAYEPVPMEVLAAAYDGPRAVSSRVDVHEAAEILCCSTRTVWRLVDVGRLPEPVGAGNRAYWDRSAVESVASAGFRSRRKRVNRPKDQRGRFVERSVAV